MTMLRRGNSPKEEETENTDFISPVNKEELNNEETIIDEQQDEERLQTQTKTRKTREVKDEFALPEERQKQWWKKEGGGSLYLKNKIVKPGEVFQAYPEDIPEAFRNAIVPIDDKAARVQNYETVKISFTKAPSKTEEGKFDILDVSGKKVNERALEASEAESLIADLQK